MFTYEILMKIWEKEITHKRQGRYRIVLHKFPILPLKAKRYHFGGMTSLGKVNLDQT